MGSLLDLVREDIRLGQVEIALRDLEALDRKLQEAQREIALLVYSNSAEMVYGWLIPRYLQDVVEE